MKKEMMTGGQLAQIYTIATQQDCGKEGIQSLIESGKLAEFFKGAAAPSALDLKIVSVDYAQPLPAMIAAGRYDWINDDITVKRFPVKGEGVAEFETKLFQFDGISSENAIKEIEAQGWQTASVEHLLSFGAKNPDEQRKYPIIALGSIGEVGGGRHVPCLDGDVSERFLDLFWWDDDWLSFYRFLAVRRLFRPSGS